MKVVYSIGARFAGGGIGTTAYHQVRGLECHGMLRRLLCGSFRPTEIPQERIRALGLPSRAMRKLATFDASKRMWHAHSVLYDLWASCRLEPADVFFVWGNDGLRSLRRAKEMGMISVVQRASSHSRFQVELLSEEYASWGLPFHIPETSLERADAEFALADYVLIPSGFVRESFLSYNFDGRRLLEAPFGVDTQRFRPVQPKAPHPFRVLCVGQISIRKGIPYLLAAWERLKWHDAELYLVGAIPRGLAPFLKEQLMTMQGVKLVGYVADPVSLYQQADVFAFPSIEEGSALVTYEALACGLPVITTANAGSVVRDGKEGFLVPIRDPDALAERLQRLRTDEELRQAMGRAARRRAEEFTWLESGGRLVRTLRSLA